MWPPKSGSRNPLLSVGCLELNGDFSHPSRECCVVMVSGGSSPFPVAKVRLVHVLQDGGWVDQGPRARHVSSAFLQVPLHSPLLHLQSHGSPLREASKSGQTSSESISILGASV